MKIEYFEFKGAWMFTLNGKPMTMVQREQYAKECDLAFKKYRKYN